MKDINLMPEEEKINSQAAVKSKLDFQISFNGIKTKTVITGVVIVVAAVLLLVAPKIYIKVQNARLDSIQKEMVSAKYTEINNVNSETAAVSATLALKQSIIDTISKQTYSVNEIFQALKSSLPAGVSITNLTYDSATLSVNLKSTDINKIAEFLLNVNRLNFLTVNGDVPLSVSKDNVTSISFKLGNGGGN